MIRPLIAVCLILSGFFLICSPSRATGMIPESSVIIVEESDGEGMMNIRNSDSFPVLLLTTIQDIRGDSERLLAVTPPTARVEAKGTQLVRFILTTQTPLKTERLRRVIFEGVPPRKKGENQVRMTVRQNLPLIIRPAGLARDAQPWKKLVWKYASGVLTVSNPSPYVVRLAQSVKGMPSGTQWSLPDTFILPEQTFTLKQEGNKSAGNITSIRLSPATTWGYSVEHYDAPLNR